jgi:hypothetical protein
MPAQPQHKTGKPRVLRARRIRKKSYADECRALQEQVREDRHGELMPDSTEVIRAMREGEIR